MIFNLFLAASGADRPKDLFGLVFLGLFLVCYITLLALFYWRIRRVTSNRNNDFWIPIVLIINIPQYVDEQDLPAFKRENLLFLKCVGVAGLASMFLASAICRPN